MGIVPLSLSKIKENIPNLYEAVVVAAKRARKLNDDQKQEFNSQLSTLTTGKDDDYEDKENPEQLKLSLEFEKKEKPHLKAIKEVRDGLVEYRYRNEKEK